MGHKQDALEVRRPGFEKARNLLHIKSPCQLVRAGTKPAGPRQGTAWRVPLQQEKTGRDIQKEEKKAEGGDKVKGEHRLSCEWLLMLLVDDMGDIGDKDLNEYVQ